MTDSGSGGAENTGARAAGTTLMRPGATSMGPDSLNLSDALNVAFAQSGHTRSIAF